MKISAYPAKVWVLTPSFKPKEVELTSFYSSYNGVNYHHTADKYYNDTEIALTKAEIIAVGKERLAKQKADQLKRQVGIDKREAALKAAEAK